MTKKAYELITQEGKLHVFRSKRSRDRFWMKEFQAGRGKVRLSTKTSKEVAA